LTSEQITKEDLHVDEKKNVGFVPGLALLLACLALVLIAINAIKPTPSMETVEKVMDQKLGKLNEAILTVVKNGDIVERKINRELFWRDLNRLEWSLEAMKKLGEANQSSDYDSLIKAIHDFRAKVGGFAVDDAAPPPKAPAEVKKEEPKKEEVKKEEPKKEEVKKEEPKKEHKGKK
jgi:hypothetical protein